MTNLLLDVRPVRVCLRCGGRGERHPRHHLDSLLLRGGHTRHLRPRLESQQVRGIKWVSMLCFNVFLTVQNITKCDTIRTKFLSRPRFDERYLMYSTLWNLVWIRWFTAQSQVHLGHLRTKHKSVQPIVKEMRFYKCVFLVSLWSLEPCRQRMDVWSRGWTGLLTHCRRPS